MQVNRLTDLHTDSHIFSHHSGTSSHSFGHSYIDDDSSLLSQSPQKQMQYFQQETLNIVRQEIKRFKDTSLYLFPTMHELHDSIEKESKKSETVYNTTV